MKLHPKLQRILLSLGPAVLVAVGSAVIFIVPKNSIFKVEQGKLSELLKEKQPTDITSQARRRSELKEEFERLTQQLAEVNSNGLRYVSKSGRNATGGDNGSPAQSIAELIQLLESNGMVCLSCQSNVQSKAIPPDSNNHGNIAREESINHSTTKSPSRREVTIELKGSFVQLQKSLQALGSIHGPFEIVSITMGEVDAQSSSRLWKLRVMV